MLQGSSEGSVNIDGLNQSLMMMMVAAAATATLPDSQPLLLYNDKYLDHVSQTADDTAENLTNLWEGNATTITTTTNTTIIHNDTATLGEKTDFSEEPFILLITLTICYALIFVAGVLGNLITCIVIARNNFMHTATNFYLFNLAVSDLILLVSGIPGELYNLWNPGAYPFTDTVCIMGSVLSETSANATVLTITAFTVERYIAICHPFRQHTMSKLSRAIKFIFAIWITALLLALPQAMQFSVVIQDHGYACTMEDVFDAHVFAVSGFIFFGGPMTAICVLYVLIGVKLKRSRLLQSLPRRFQDANRGLNAQSRVIRMLVAVAVAFFLCWAPFHAQRLMAVYGLSLINIGISRDAFSDYFRILDYTSGVLYFLSTCINPLLYNIMSHKFREAFKITLTRQMMAGKSPQNQHQQYQHNYSALLRQNGSMRLQTCSVNNNALEPYGSYRVVQFRCRDVGHHQPSLQDSVRTTTTTTTMNSSSCSGPNVGSSASGSVSASAKQQQQHARCSSLRRNDLYGSCGGNGSPMAKPHRLLHHHHHSQDDSDDEAEVMVEAVRHYAVAKRALLATNNGALLVSPTSTPGPPCPPAVSTNANTMAMMMTSTTATTNHHPTTSGKRLKLSRVISRRDETAYNVELMCGVTATEQPAGRKFPWRKMRQKREQPLSATSLPLPRTSSPDVGSIGVGVGAGTGVSVGMGMGRGMEL